MKSLSPELAQTLSDEFFYALDPVYYLQVEAAGNIVAYRSYLSMVMLGIHSALANDSDEIEVQSAVELIYRSAPWFI